MYKIYNQIIQHHHDELIPFQEDIKIFSLQITTYEGEYTMAEIISDTPYQAIPQICLFFNHIPFFRGIFYQGSEDAHNNVFKILFIAKSNTIDEENIDDTKENHDLLQNVPFQDFYLYQVDPVSHQKKLFDLLQNKEPINLTPFLLHQNIKIKRVYTPIQDLCITLSATWSQKKEGVFNIFPYIKKQFPFSKVQTLTGVNFQSSLPYSGQKIYNNHAFTGYTFALSYIKPIKKDFLVLSKKNDTFHIPRYEFDGKLFLSWSILFKRCEKIHLFVRFDSNNHQLSFGQKNKTAISCMDFSVNTEKIFEENGEFLITQKGIHAQRQAFKMGIFKMIRSHFSHIMCCYIHFENAFQLNCGDVVKVFYQNHWHKGYISSIKHTINSQTAKSQISFFINTPRILTSDIEAFVEKCIKKIQHISPDLSMEDDVFKDITKLRDEDFIENITVHNPYEEQLQQLKQDALQTKQDLLKNLHQHPTVVDITFKNLNNKKIKEKNIYIMEDSYALA